MALLFEYLCGKGAINKKIPDFVFQLHFDLIRVFINAYLNGDGCKIKGREKYVITTASRQIAEQFILLSEKFNYVPAIQYYKYPKRKGGFYTISFEGESIKKMLGYPLENKFVQTLTFRDKRGFWIPVTKKKIKSFSGEVYNFETQDNTYAVPFLVHNCQLHIMGIEEEKIPELKRISKEANESRYNPTKLKMLLKGAIGEQGCHIDLRLVKKGAA